MAIIHRNFIYNEDSEIIFAYVPKVACTNWKSLLRYMAGHQDWLNQKLVHDKVAGGLRYLDLTGADADLLSCPNIRKYAMVRDPYSRVLSAYLNKVESRLAPRIEAPFEDHFHTVVRDIDAFRRKKLGARQFPRIDFEVFLRWLQQGGSVYTQDEHWTSQSVLLHQPEVSFDFIGRFENLAVDAARILKEIGCDREFPSQKDVGFAATGAQSKLDQYYNATTRQLVNDIFAKDFENFAYTASR
ncbi:sulfotransferase family protein [Anderseniella sp. Alg231-50]|uniref:sulfotransferase family protein n=1 Tax=Anderseniella sp. Alg231-50 TaxID=1922226 RepID=UPI00307B15D7